MYCKLITHPLLGSIHIRESARARRLSFRTKADGVYATVPSGTRETEINRAINELLPRLLKARKQTPQQQRIDLDYKIDTEYFKLRLLTRAKATPALEAKAGDERFLAHSELGELTVFCPPSADFADEKLQAWLRKVIGEALRRNAQIILPPRLYQLSLKHGFTYKTCKITAARGRWGSCSGRGTISLSYYLVLLPRHLMDYVLLHELCHTKEMNHSPRFWSLLDSVTDGQADLLRKELKGYRTDF